MRGILFRGKDDERKDFVYGLLSLERDCRNPKMLCIVKPCIVWEESGLLYSSFVMPETVGQYTGLTDKNGKKIFEGDIVKHFNAFNAFGAGVDIGKVCWDDKYCQFYRTSNRGMYNYRVGTDCSYEVVGNIHENQD